MDYSLRRTWIITEQIHAEHGRDVEEVITRIVGLAAIDNPYHADHQEDLSPLFHVGAAVTEPREEPLRREPPSTRNPRASR